MSVSLWVEIGDRPSVGFFLGSRPPTALMPAIYYNTLSELGKLRRPLGIGMETANIDIAVDNGTGEMATLIDKLSSDIKVKTHDGVSSLLLFEGALQSLPQGDQRLSMRAIGDSMLDTLKLRKSSDLPGFSELVTLPRVVGKAVPVKPIPYSTDGTSWLLSYSAIRSIVGVFADDEALGPESYLLSNEIGPLGEKIALLLLVESPKNTDSLIAIVDGETDPEEAPVDGVLPATMTNPARIVRHLIDELTNTVINPSSLDRFRRDTDALVLRGVVDGDYSNARSLVDDIARSSGARWSTEAPGLLTLWPPSRGTNDPIYFTLTSLSGWDVVSTPLERISRLTVNYGYDWAARGYSRAIVLRAPLVERDIGEIEGQINLKWVGDDATAERVGRRELAYRAAKRFTVTWTTTDESARQAGPGRWVRLDHPHSRLTGTWPLTESAIDLLTTETDMTAEGYIGSLPSVEVLLRSQKQSLSQRSIKIEQIAGAAVITITDPDTGRPLPGAQVVVDNRVFITDATGEITVTGVKSGQTLLITVTPAGGEPFQVSQTI